MSVDMSFGPISSRVTIQDGVYQQLRQALMDGKFDPGQTLTIAGLAESHSVRATCPYVKPFADWQRKMQWRSRPTDMRAYRS